MKLPGQHGLPMAYICNRGWLNKYLDPQKRFDESFVADYACDFPLNQRTRS